MKPQRQKRSKIAENSKITGSAEEPTIEVVIAGLDSPGNHQNISILDINDSGMGITCTTPLKVGQHLLFNNQNTDWELPEKGIVMWTFKANNRFRAGIKFI